MSVASFSKNYDMRCEFQPKLFQNAIAPVKTYGPHEYALESKIVLFACTISMVRLHTRIGVGEICATNALENTFLKAYSIPLPHPPSPHQADHPAEEQKIVF